MFNRLQIIDKYYIGFKYLAYLLQILINAN